MGDGARENTRVPQESYVYEPLDIEKLSYQQLKALTLQYDEWNLITGKIGVAQNSPASVYHVLMRHEHADNPYTSKYSPICRRASNSGLLVKDVANANLDGRRLCGHCENKKRKWINFKRLVQENER